MEPDGVTLSIQGLFPSRHLSTPVLVPDEVSSTTKYGIRTLTRDELGELWDVPLSSLERLADSPALLRGLLSSPPAKFLELGADMLLTASFRGVAPNCCLLWNDK